MRLALESRFIGFVLVIADARKGLDDDEFVSNDGGSFEVVEDETYDVETDPDAFGFRAQGVRNG